LVRDVDDDDAVTDVSVGKQQQTKESIFSNISSSSSVEIINK
jgi:hypothetical protein